MKVLHSTEILTQKAISLGIQDWAQLIAYVRALPYGRISDLRQLERVFIEQRGSCSSKHALLKKIADENQMQGVELILGIFKMGPKNTPEAGAILADNGLKYIPEAHCYLRVDGQRIDATKQGFDINDFAQDILTEMVINVEQIADYKVNMHKNFLKKWLVDQSVPFTPEAIWEIRERCIKKLSEPNASSVC